MSGLNKRQQEMRRTGIGASEIAALAGLSKWSSPIAIYEAKLGIGPDLDSYAADLGVEIEAPIARVWAKRAKRFLSMVDTLRHPKLPFAVATPDRAVYASAEARGDGRRLKTIVSDAEKLLQVKSTNWRMRHLWGDEDTDSIPDEYLVQAHWEGSVAQQQIVDFAVDFDKTSLHTYRVIVDEQVFLSLYEIAERFMKDHVLARVPPPPDATERYHEFITRSFPRETLKDFETVQPSAEPSLLEAINTYAKLQTVEKRMKALKQLARNRIEARIGGAPGLLGEFGKISWKKTKDRQVTDWKKVADESMRIAQLVVQTMPDGEHRAALAEDLRKLIDEATTTRVGHRMFRPTWAKHLQLESEAIEMRFDVLQQGLAEGDVDEQGGEQQSQ